MIEDFFKLVLFQVGLLRANEERVMSNFDKGLQVSGRLDVLFGGKFDIQNISEILNRLTFLSFIGILSRAILEFAERNKKTIYDISGLEIKSVSDYMYNKIYARGSAEPHHLLQCFHYAYWKQMPFQLVYFDKNNGRIIEFWVLPNDKELYKLYCADILQMSEYYTAKTLPPKEKLIKFETGRFSENWNVLYSKYLTHSYGFNTKEEYKNHVLPKIGRWNRVMARIKDGKQLTPDNREAIDEMRKAGYDVGVPEIIDIEHEDVSEPIIKSKDSTENKMAKLKLLLE
jgi:hypothetical protein